MSVELKVHLSISRCLLLRFDEAQNKAEMLPLSSAQVLNNRLIVGNKSLLLTVFLHARPSDK